LFVKERKRSNITTNSGFACGLVKTSWHGLAVEKCGIQYGDGNISCCCYNVDVTNRLYTG